MCRLKRYATVQCPKVWSLGRRKPGRDSGDNVTVRAARLSRGGTPRRCRYGDRVTVSAGALPDLQAVLFDMDGTLTDSERLWTIALNEVAASYGGRLTQPAREAMVGQDMWASIDLFHADLALAVDPNETAHRLNEATRLQFAAGLPWRPGARELLIAVRAAGLRTALVTATHRELVEIALETLGRENFDVTVAGDEVVNNKPDPEPYVRALELLEIAPAAALAIEDSPTGSAAALAAGLPVLVVPSEIPVVPAGGMVQLDTLTGVGVQHLAALRAELLTPWR